MTTYIELCQYFEGMVNRIPGLSASVVGADEVDIDMQGSRIRYPLLRLDTPEITYGFEDEATQTTTYKTRMYIMAGVAKDTPSSQNQTLSDLERLMRRIYNTICADAADGQFDIIVGPNQGDAIRKWGSDNSFGWYMDLRISLFTAAC